MYHQFELLLGICRRVGQQGCKRTLGEVPLFQFLNSRYSSSTSFPSNLVKVRAFHLEEDSVVKCRQTEDSKEQTMHINKTAFSVQNLLKEFSNSSKEMLFQALNNSGLSLSDDLVLEVLRRLHSDWKLAFQFFNWASNDPSGFSPGSRAFNEMLGILGKAKQFEELDKFFSEMSLRGVVNERSYGIMVHRFAAAHRADDAIEFFYKRRQHGLELDLIAFQTLLLALCRYKHVEAAEYLFLSKRSEFRYDTKTWNIILNGWCVLGNLRETKRFWNEMIRSKCKPDKVTYGIFINALCKSGKISTAVKLFHAMWEKGCTPDVVICNSIIDGLCFKKRIPEAIGILREMNEKDCEPDVVTYNCLIKHLCKIGRMEIVHQLLDEMEMKGQNCSPNSRTYIHLLTTTKRPEEVQGLLERMKSNGCKMTGDLYNLLLKLYMNWDCEELVQSTWAEMSRDGFGPGQPSYTIMVHGLYEQGRIEDAFAYFEEMTSKGMVPEPRTKILVDAMKIKMDAKPAQRTGNARFSGHAHKRGKAKVSGLPHQNAMKFYTTLSNDPDTHDDFKPTSKLESSDLSVKDIVEQDVKENPIMIYMKGVPEMPRCGFSSLAVRVLKEYGVPFSSRNILEDMELKNAVKAFSHWPTFPQIFIKGEFIGGSDIILNMHQTGELEQKLKDLSSQKKGG